MSSSDRALVMETVGPDEVDAIRRYVQCRMPKGRTGFARRSKHSWDDRPVPARSAGRRSRIRRNTTAKGHSDPNGTYLTPSA